MEITNEKCHYSTKWRKNNPEKAKQIRNRYTKSNPDKVRKWRRSNRLDARKRTRLKAIKLYGSVCSCCNESLFGFLTFDHINGISKEEKSKYGKTINRGRSTYKFVKDLLHRPIDANLRVFCFNCNCSRNSNSGICPHNEVISIPAIESDMTLKEKSSIRRKKRRKRIKLEALELYGYECKCCGEKQPEFLTFDHINGISEVDRLKFRSGKNHSTLRFYQYLIKYKPDDIQVLCFNCNCARATNKSICPHKVIQEP